MYWLAGGRLCCAVCCPADGRRLVHCALCPRRAVLCCARCAQAMCADYGFRSGAGRLYQDKYGEVPKSIVDLVRQG